MATGSSRAHCIKRGKEKATVKCSGCSQDFCYTHWTDHRQELSVQLDQIEVNRDLLRQTLNEQTTNPNKHSLIKQIDRWEEDSIRKIQQTAKECRQLILQQTTEYINQIETNLLKLTDQLREIRQENDFDEIDLQQFKQKLSNLTEELDKPSNISIEQDSTLLVNKISVIKSSRRLMSSAHTNINTKWRLNGITVAGGNGQGDQLNQLSHLCGIYIDENQWIYIADRDNHRIVQWKCDAKNGQVVAGGNGKGNRMDQLDCPTDVIVDKRNHSLIVCDRGNRRVVQFSSGNSTTGQIIISDIDCYGITMDKNGNLYVSGCTKHEVRRWKIGEKNGTIVAGGNGKGNNRNQLNDPYYISVDEDHSVYVADNENYRVIKWMKGANEGVVVAGAQGKGNSLSQLDYIYGVTVNQSGHVYVADSGNQRIMRWSKGSKEGWIVLDGNGDWPNQFSCLRGLSFDRQNNLYVVDFQNHRVQKFHIDSN